MSATPNVYWLAVAASTEEVSYEELKYRMVVAQGWPALSVESLIPFVIDGDRAAFDSIFTALYKRVYPTDQERAARIMWDLLSLKQGDIIVAIEGRKVSGITELTTDSVSSYRHDKFHQYANSISYGVNWRDWETVSPDFVPTAPSQSVQGIRQPQQDREQVLKVWNAFNNR